jgi:hypothetical protein
MESVFEEIIEGIPVKRIRKKADQIKESIRCSLDTTQVILIRGGLRHIESIQERIDELDWRSRAESRVRRMILGLLCPFPEKDLLRR